MQGCRGQDVIILQMRSCCLLTAVTRLSILGSKAHWWYLKLLCIKAFSLCAFNSCRRSVLTRNVMMVDLWAHPPSSWRAWRGPAAQSASDGLCWRLKQG